MIAAAPRRPSHDRVVVHVSAETKALHPALVGQEPDSKDGPKSATLYALNEKQLPLLRAQLRVARDHLSAVESRQSRALCARRVLRVLTQSRLIWGSAASMLGLVAGVGGMVGISFAEPWHLHDHSAWAVAFTVSYGLTIGSGAVGISLPVAWLCAEEFSDAAPPADELARATQEVAQLQGEIAWRSEGNQRTRFVLPCVARVLPIPGHGPVSMVMDYLVGDSEDRPEPQRGLEPQLPA